ncbi:phosphatidic acid phosphatase type 2D [Latimeria chalumnae]|uniref:Phosphatidic acid phosphatase type 2D n=1 Tax=Latimeria chalumnae TaxID=7897 RepID=H3AJU5_LATCH|nr:PREDICTED: lipid phosphate phosphohydrolase 3-like [Latimeria chalumnae]|eukprot:XP_006008641.1 PREDICTED: lipid phosphate phosphohydrolase 3-like [Latimeria chalumnae]
MMQNCGYNKTPGSGYGEQGSPHGDLQVRAGEQGSLSKENGAGRKVFESRSECQTGHRKLLVCLDIVCLLVASIPFLVCEIKAIKPYNRGFYCDDTSIQYPFLKTETISDPVLIAAGNLITGLVIVVGESYRVRRLNPHSRSFVINPYVRVIYKEIGAFMFGCAIGQSLTNMAKVTVGRLRPNFLSVCKVNLSTISCSQGYYNENYNCTGNQSLIIEGRKSFYSGHASFAMYTMLYLVFYLQARFTWHGARLLRPLIQFLLLMIALYTGLSRISDYKHHPSDVLAGFLQGALVAYWVTFHISSMFKSKRNCKEESPASPQSPVSNHHTVC